MKTNKFSLTKILLCVSLVFAMLGASLFFVNQSKGVKAAEEIDVTDTIKITVDNWMTNSGNATDCTTFSIRVNNADGEGYRYEYLVADSSIQGYWNDNGPSFATTNGVDVMDYLYFNGESARNIVASNTSYTGTTFPLDMGGVYAPIALETVGSFTKFMVLNDWMPSDGFIITIKSGFKLLLSDGNTIVTSKDVSFQYANGAIAKVVTVEELDVTDTITLTQDDWMTNSGNATDCTTFSIRVNNADGEGYRYEYLVANPSIQGYWNDNGPSFATKNGVDIMDYLYFNGESARNIVANNTSYTGTTFPLDMGGVYAPIALETVGSFTKFMVLNDWMPSDGFIITIKSGFRLLLNDGKHLVTSKDVSFRYNGPSVKTFTKVNLYTLSFECSEGTVDPITVVSNSAISSLPAVPKKAGHVGVWCIGETPISSVSVWNYSENKTATAVYAEYEDISDRLSMEERGWSLNGATDASAMGLMLDGAYMISAYPFPYWNDHIDNSNSNYGVDIMEYIHINGVSSRSLINENASKPTEEQYKGSATFPLSNGREFAPVSIETAGVDTAGIWIRVLSDFAEEYDVTIKAGFTFVDLNDKVLYVSKDVTFKCKSGSAPARKCTVSFEADESYDSVSVYNGNVVILPTLPERVGYDVTWQIDGTAVSNELEFWYNADVTAVAVYTAKTYTLTIEGEDPITVTYDQAIGTLPSRVGYNLTYTIDDAPITEATVWNYVEDKTAVVTATAKTYTLSFEGLQAEDNVTVTYDQAVGALPAVPEQSGKVGRWMLDGEELTADTVWTIDSDMQAVADYTTFYTVTFNGADGVQVAENGKVDAPQNPTKESTAEFDFAFDGWYNGEEKWNFDEDVVTSDLNLVAKFTESRRSYAVTFDGEDETVIEYGSKITKPANPTKADTAEYTYTFDGWFNGEEEWDFENDVVTGEVHLVSKFTQANRTYTVSFNVSGREDVTLEDKTVEYGADVDLSKLLEGIDCSGYNVAITIGGVEVDSINVTQNVTVDVTFTAVENGGEGGCAGSMAGVSMLSALSLLAVSFLRKKSR